MTTKNKCLFPDIGLGILSWKGYESLNNTLQTYSEQDFLGLFGETRVFLPEAENEGRKIAQSFGLEYSESDENLGILGGFEALAKSMSSRYVVLLENDLPIIENQSEAIRQIRFAHSFLQDGQAQVVRLRHRKHWGADFNIVDKFKRLHGGPDIDGLEFLKTAFHRTFRPGKARRISGNAVYVYEDAHERFSDVISYDEESDMHFVSSSAMNWTNQSILIEREFFLDKIIGYAKTAPTTRRVNGFRNLEIEMNSPYWRDSGWKVCVTPGLLTHERQDYRGY